MIFRAVKGFVERMSTKVTRGVKGAFSNNNTIDVEATDVH
jgi:hypothetical protein